MKVCGYYEDSIYYGFRLQKGSRLAVEVSIAWTESKKNSFLVAVRSGCYKLSILEKNGDWLSEEKANELVRRIATEDTVILDDVGAAFFYALDTTPEAYYVRNAVDEYYEPIPLEVTSV